MKKYLFTLLIMLILIQSCQKQNLNKFSGIWKINQTDSSYSELKIDEENTFSYQSYGNGNKTFSKGHFRFNGDSIILVSVNAVDIDKCYIVLEFGECVFEELRQTQSDCQPSKNEFYEYFDSEVFYLDNNSLIYKNNLKDSCPDSSETKFMKSKN